jgi:hypothetical protein
MFTDDISTEVIVQPEQSEKRDNSITPTAEHHNTTHDNKGTFAFNVK